jgi:hypothetical protein
MERSQPMQGKQQPMQVLNDDAVVVVVVVVVDVVIFLFKRYSYMI